MQYLLHLFFIFFVCVCVSHHKKRICHNFKSRSLSHTEHYWCVAVLGILLKKKCIDARTYTLTIFVILRRMKIKHTAVISQRIYTMSTISVPKLYKGKKTRFSAHFNLPLHSSQEQLMFSGKLEKTNFCFTIHSLSY